MSLPSENDALEAPATVAEIRVFSSYDDVQEASLVLASGQLPYRVRRGPTGWALDVLVSDLGPASQRLALWEAERQEVVLRAPRAPDRGPSYFGIVSACALLLFPFVTGLGSDHGRDRWFTAGTAVAERILSGEWWRAATAMTLHGDLMHVIGNVLAALIFFGPLGRWVGAGVAAWATVTGAFLANLTTAAIEKHDFASVGASTATFAALGVLAGLQVTRRLRGGRFDKRRAWISAGAALALFAMLGSDSQSKMSTGPGIDVWGHLTGLGFGLVLGLGLGAVPPRLWLRPRPRLDWLAQVAASAATVGFLAFAWWRALH